MESYSILTLGPERVRVQCSARESRTAVISVVVTRRFLRPTRKLGPSNVTMKPASRSRAYAESMRSKAVSGVLVVSSVAMDVAR